jgi:hypothetical protein
VKLRPADLFAGHVPRLPRATSSPAHAGDFRAALVRTEVPSLFASPPQPPPSRDDERERQRRAPHPEAEPVRAADSPTFRAKLAELGQRLGVAPSLLVAVMHFESGISPTAQNRTSHATGLIQFMPHHAADLLHLPADLPRRGAIAVELVRGMSAEAQLDLVEQHYRSAIGGRKITCLRDAYMAVFWPAAVGHGPDFIIARKDAPDAYGRLVYEQNAALDTNHDGTITAGEAARAVEGSAGAVRALMADVDRLTRAV